MFLWIEVEDLKFKNTDELKAIGADIVVLIVVLNRNGDLTWSVTIQNLSTISAPLRSLLSNKVDFQSFNGYMNNKNVVWTCIKDSHHENTSVIW